MSHRRLTQLQSFRELTNGCTLVCGTQNDAQNLQPCRVSDSPQRSSQLLSHTTIKCASNMRLRDGLS